MIRFPRKPSIGLLALLGIILISLTALSFGYRRWTSGDRIRQPIAFNHQVHVTEAQIECSDCHTHYSDGPRSGLPDVETCMACHSDAVTESAEEKLLRDRYEQKQSVVFRKLFHLPADVYYSHRRHVGIGKIECVECHGNIAETKTPPQRPLVQITMDFCLDCHSKSKVTGDCKSCHR